MEKRLEFKIPDGLDPLALNDLSRHSNIAIHRADARNKVWALVPESNLEAFKKEAIQNYGLELVSEI